MTHYRIGKHELVLSDFRLFDCFFVEADGTNVGIWVSGMIQRITLDYQSMLRQGIEEFS